MDSLISDLSKTGITVDNIYDLVNTKSKYPSAIPILIDALAKGNYDLKTKEGIVRSLAVKEAKGKANKVLIDEYNNTPISQMMYRWVIGNTLNTIIVENDIDRIIPIVLNKENGMSRQMFVSALGKLNTPLIENTLIQVIDDDNLFLHVLSALKKFKSENVRKAIENLSKHSNSRIRKEASKALEQIFSR